MTDWLIRNDVMSTFRPQVDILINTEYNERSCSFHQKKNRIASAIYRDTKLSKPKILSKPCDVGNMAMLVTSEY